MKIAVIYDNWALKGFKPAWGFSALIETSSGEKVLFDTGGSCKVWTHNAKRLGIDFSSFRDVFLSHFHWDHIGTVLDIAYTTKGKHFVIPDGFSKVFVSQLVESGHQVSLAREPYRFSESFISTGGMKTPIKNLYEQALIAFEGDKYALVVGCAHMGVVEATKRAIELTKKPPELLIGGFHLFGEDEITVIAVAEELLHMGVKRIAPCHCTGDKNRQIFEDVFGPMFADARAGSVIEL